MSDEQMFKAVKQYEQYGTIIPCSECKHFERWENTPGNGYCNYGAGRYTFGGGYCDKAQRKDGDLNDT